MSFFEEIAAHSRFTPEKLAKNNLFTTERLFCDVYCFEPGQAQSAHSHADSDKIYCVIDGSAEIRVGEEERRVSAGAVVLAPAGAPHAVSNPGPGRLRLLVLMAPRPR
jgi:mannose-6-phosphate isomerase-like protein (cupin superfamily)